MTAVYGGPFVSGEGSERMAVASVPKPVACLSEGTLAL